MSRRLSWLRAVLCAGAPPDIFTALEEQLGLKLQPGKAEIETFVIDPVAMPSED